MKEQKKQYLKSRILFKNINIKFEQKIQNSASTGHNFDFSNSKILNNERNLGK